MKAMVLEEFRPVMNKPLKLMEQPVPAPQPGELLLWIEYCGVCHTDLHIVEGDLKDARLPIIPGHQVAGIVVKAGEGAGEKIPVGVRAGAAWLFAACGFCDYCLNGRENLCRMARFTGFHVHGGYAEYMVIPEKFAYRIPEDFTNLHAAPLLCAGIIGYRALRLSGAAAGSRLGLYGFGASAHIAIQVAKARGCEVYVFSRNEKHRQHARELGALWTGDYKDEPPSKHLSSVVFSPAGEVVLNALENTDRGGTVALAGITMTPIPEIDYVKHLYLERTLTTVANATRSDGEDLLKLASEIPIKTTTKLFALKEANEALLELKESRIKGAAVLKIGK